MLRKIKLIILASLLVGGAIVCAIRWKAWFAIPPEPKWEGDTIEVIFKTFADVLDVSIPPHFQEIRRIHLDSSVIEFVFSLENHIRTLQGRKVCPSVRLIHTCMLCSDIWEEHVVLRFQGYNPTEYILSLFSFMFPPC